MKICSECQSEYNDDVEFCARDGMKLRAAMAQSADPLIGRALDERWVIEEKIGEGGMGAVYKGYQRGVNRKIAVKTLRAALIDNQEFVDRFFREGRVATTIANPHCVTIYDYGQTPDGTLFLAMEYLDGKPLTDVLKAREISTREVLKIGVQISAALAAAHGERIVHRDLKPDNIFLLNMADGSTFSKVLDFGIAKDTGSAAEKYTRTGQIFGTPAYMSPEQCIGSALDGRSDLYSLGIILYELVSRTTPFGGKTTSPMKILLDHVNTPAPTLDPALALPPGLVAIIMRLLEKSPDARFPDAKALQQALEAELGQIDGHDAMRRTGQLPSPRQSTASVPAAPAPLSAPPASRKLGLALVALVALVLVAGGAALAVYKSGADAKSPAAPIAAQPALVAAPVVEQPVAEAPAVEAPAVEVPVVEAPVVEVPVVEVPVVEVPLAKAPKTKRDKKPVADKEPVEDKKPADKKPADKKPKDKTDQMVDALF